MRATDGAGNAGPAATSDYVLDTAAPAAPSIDSGPGAAGTDTTPTWSFSGEAGATFECRLEHTAGAAVSDWAACTSSHTYDISAQGDGSYTFRVRAVDAAGNTGADATSSYTFDNTVPAQPTIDATPGVAGSGRQPSWSFSGEAGSTFECRLERGGTGVSDWADSTSPAPTT